MGNSPMIPGTPRERTTMTPTTAPKVEGRKPKVEVHYRVLLMFVRYRVLLDVCALPCALRRWCVTVSP